ncbi:MAG: DUF4835 family protein [Bacteroidales bacterium]|nr:DUF4835 family protein [Bacteroidales bacterium]
MYKILIISVLCAFTSLNMHAQELLCRVSVSATALSNDNTVDKTIFTTLEKNMTAFLNDRRWTNLDFKSSEKIECAIQLVIEQSKGNDRYAGKMYVNLSRPVFNSSYNSPLLAFQDNYIEFQYQLNQSFDYADGNYLWTITSVLAYYANLFLGIYFDCQGMNGGSAFFDKCTDIVNGAPDSEVGWSRNQAGKSDERRNRYQLLETYTSPSYNAIHEVLYKYHRLGLDVMSSNVVQGTESVTSALEALGKLNSSHPNLTGVVVFCMTKVDEIVNIYSGKDAETKRKIATLMKKIDPSNSVKFDKMANL